MKCDWSRVSRTAIAVATLTFPMAAFAQATTPSAAGGVAAVDAAAGIDDIVVTAERRSTSLQRTPQAIAVLQGETQFERGQTALLDIKTAVPNVNFASTSNTSQLYIRGVGNTFLNAGGDPGVALYQDNAYISDQTTTNVNLFDVDRVELIKGPQGALYGRNATGGAITIASARPTSILSGKISATLGDYAERDTEGYISGPLGVANTDARLSYQVRHHAGYVRNQLAGTPGAPSSLDDLDSQAARIQTLTHFAGGGSLRALFSYYQQKDNGDALAVTPTPGIAYAVETLYGAVPGSDPYSVQANVGSNRIKVYTGNLELLQPIGRANLTVTGNYRRSEQNFLNDCDGTRINNCRYFRTNTSDDYFLDTHVAGPDDVPLRWLVGATYLKFDIDQLNVVNFPFPLSYLNPAAPPTVPFGFVVTAGGRINVESYAAYADLRLRLSEVWSVTAQARYSSTKKTANELLLIPDFATNIPAFPSRAKTERVPYKVAVQGQLTPDILVYANYATAYKDAAINLGALQATPIRPESVRNVEAGFKTSFLDRRMQINGAVFDNRYVDLQISQLAGTVIALANVPRSRITGAELEIVAAPATGLRLNASFGYLDAKLNQFTNSRILPGLAGGPPLDLSGKRLPYVAGFSAVVGADYSFTPVAGYDARLGANYSYQSRTYFTEFNDAYNSQAPVGVFDISASIGQQDKGWQVFGYVRNLTDQIVRTGSTTYSGLIGGARAVSYAPPRHFGVGAAYRF